MAKPPSASQWLDQTEFRSGAQCWICSNEDARKWVDEVLDAMEADPTKVTTPGSGIGKALKAYFGYPRSPASALTHLKEHTDGRWARIKGRG